MAAKRTAKAADSRAEITKRAGDNFEASLANLSEPDRQAVEAMAQATIAGGIHAADTPMALVYGAASMAHALGLRADLGHVMVYSTRQRAKGGGDGWDTQHRFYITESGWQAWAAQFDQYSGAEWRPLGPDERQALLIRQPLALEVKIHRSDWAVPAVAIGYADPGNTDNFVEKNDPLAMALARAFRRAMARAFPINARRVAEAERQAARGAGLEALGAEALAEAAALPQPTSPPTDEWRNFWVSVSHHKQWHHRSRADVHAHVAGRLGITLPTTAPDADGVVESTFVGSSITPEAAWTALVADRILEYHDPASAQTPEERLFGSGGSNAAPPTEKPQDDEPVASGDDLGDIKHALSEAIEAATQVPVLEKIRVQLVVAHEAGEIDVAYRDDLNSLIDDRVASLG